MATFFTWQALQQVAPGGAGTADSGLDAEQVAESFMFALDKTLILYGVGLAAGIAGGGRLRTSSSGSQLAVARPIAMDFVNSMPRAAIISMLERLNDADPEERQVMLQQLEQAQSDPALAEELFGGE